MVIADLPSRQQLITPVQYIKTVSVINSGSQHS